VTSANVSSTLHFTRPLRDDPIRVAVDDRPGAHSPAPAASTVDITGELATNEADAAARGRVADVAAQARSLDLVLDHVGEQTSSTNGNDAVDVGAYRVVGREAAAADVQAFVSQIDRSAHRMDV